MCMPIEQYVPLPEAKIITTFCRHFRILEECCLLSNHQTISIVQPELRLHSTLDKVNGLAFFVRVMGVLLGHDTQLLILLGQCKPFSSLTTCLWTQQFNKNIINLIFSQDLPVSNVFNRANIMQKYIYFIYIILPLFLTENGIFSQTIHPNHWLPSLHSS